MLRTAGRRVHENEGFDPSHRRLLVRLQHPQEAKPTPNLPLSAAHTNSGVLHRGLIVLRRQHLPQGDAIDFPERRDSKIERCSLRTLPQAVLCLLAAAQRELRRQGKCQLFLHNTVEISHRRRLVCGGPQHSLDCRILHVVLALQRRPQVNQQARQLVGRPALFVALRQGASAGAPQALQGSNHQLLSCLRHASKRI